MSRTSTTLVSHCASRQPEYMLPAMVSHLLAQSHEIPATFLQSQTMLRSMRIVLCQEFPSVTNEILGLPQRNTGNLRPRQILGPPLNGKNSYSN